jgi:hypothetical protein
VLAFNPKAIVARGAPVLCIDTCSLLDIMRDPTRDEMKPHERKAAIDLLDPLEKGDLVCLIAEQVDREFNEHAPTVQDEAMTAIRKLRERVERVNQIHNTLLPAISISLTHLEALVAPTLQIVQRWRNASVLVPRTTDALTRAMERVNRNVSPARKGKDSVKDCLVLESYLGAMADLRSAGLPANAVFLSSNRKEYLGETNVLKTDLQPDFAQTNMAYATNMGQAKVTLGF